MYTTFYDVTDIELDTLENELHLTLPKELKEFYLFKGYGFWRGNNINRLMDPISVIDFRLRRNDYDCFNENVEMEMFKEYEVDKLVFFEADAFTYISIGFSNENEGKIYYCDIEIAESLSEFLIRIQNDENYYLERI
ncbi:SMI1/KNR4 family protein [Clostridium baratii]|uniref:SMI1/KNR4 family protein n=1 Tax=Clostridium baratii TaxID=1561 RepID=UPI0030CEDED5